MSNAMQKAEPQQTAAVVAINDNTALMAAIARAASDPTVDVEKMERLFAMHERMEARQAEVEFNAAMSRVQASMRRVSTDATNNQTRSDYATYGQLDKALRPLYTAEGLSLSFDSESAATDMLRVVCYVSHTAGHTRRYAIDMPADGKGAKGGDVMTKTHATGSAASYGMRYLLKMIFNVALGEDDDDGNGASGDNLDDKARDWVRVADLLEQPQDYQAQKKKLLADYGGKAENLPPKVREAFNRANARVMPKD